MRFLKIIQRSPIISIMTGLLMIYIVIRLIFAIGTGKSSSRVWKTEPEANQEYAAGWSDPEARELIKQILRLEQKQILAEFDSITLAINLSEQMVRIQLKGVELFHADVISQHPRNFFTEAGPDTYRRLTQASAIVWEEANLPKKPIRRIEAPANGEARKDADHKEIREKPLTWSFITSNNLKIVISGVKSAADSLPKYQPEKMLWLRAAEEARTGQFSKTYIPTLFLRLNDNDAKTIYRALPEKGLVLFCN